MELAQLAVLTPRQRRFVEEFVVDGNGTLAALRAGYSQSSAHTEANRQLNNVKVKEAVEAARLKLSEKIGISAQRIAEHWLKIASADPNDIIKHLRGPCRHCWGINHAYQWRTLREYQDHHGSSGYDPPGGFGYRHNAEINPDCPECCGDGAGYTYAVDTSTLTGSARLLYAGVKQTKDGLQILMQDQGKALENLAKHLGMFVERRQELDENGNPRSPGGKTFVLVVQK